MTVSGTNFGKAASDYGAFRAGFPDSIFDRLAEFEIGMANQTVIDLGTGTGTLARGFARSGCRVIGVDPDGRMLARAIELDQRHDVGVTYVNAKAEATGLASGLADVVAAGQCWHWFDRRRAIAEVIRVLKPGGKLVIAHFDWLPLARSLAEATERLIEQYNPDWHLGGGIGMYPQWLPDLSEAGMRGIETFSYDTDVPYTPDAWRGRIRSSAGVADLDADAVHQFDDELRELLATRFPAGVLTVPHRVFAIVADRRNCGLDADR
jgi:SAM-dependent methyltransferase